MAELSQELPCQSIVLVFDACPLTLVGCYGAEWCETPAIDEFAHGGIVYDRHYLGRIAGRHILESLALCCNETGAQAAFVASTARDSNWASSFGWQLVSGLDDASVLTLESSLDAALDFIEERRDCAFVLVVALPVAVIEISEDRIAELASDAEAPPMLDFPAGVVPDDSAEGLMPSLRAGWAIRLAAADAALARFFAELKELEVWERIAVAWTAERGVHLGEQSLFGPVDSPYDAAVHLPLVVKPAGPNRGPSRDQSLTESVDWIDRWLGSAERPRFGRAETDESLTMTHHAAGDVLPVAVHADKWKLVVPRTTAMPLQDDDSIAELAATCELFAKPEDRADVRDISRQALPKAVELLKAAIFNVRSKRIS